MHKSVIIIYKAAEMNFSVPDEVFQEYMEQLEEIYRETSYIRRLIRTVYQSVSKGIKFFEGVLPKTRGYRIVNNYNVGLKKHLITYINLHYIRQMIC